MDLLPLGLRGDFRESFSRHSDLLASSEEGPFLWEAAPFKKDKLASASYWLVAEAKPPQKEAKL